MDRARFEDLLKRDATRRRFLAAGALVGGLAAVSHPGSPTWLLAAQATPEAILVTSPTFLGNPFTLGVASGDPLPDGVVLGESGRPGAQPA